MNKNKLRFYIVVAAVFVAFTVISFAVPFVKNGAFWVAYIFAVLAIAAQVYVYPKAFDGASAKSNLQHHLSRGSVCTEPCCNGNG